MMGSWMVWALGASVAGDIPVPVQAWSDGVANFYTHYKAVVPAWEPDSDAFPPCPKAGEPIPEAPRSSMSVEKRAEWTANAESGAAACAALRPGGWRLQMRLLPMDQRIFSPLVLRVSEVSEGRTAEAVVSELVDHGIWAARGFQALIPVGRYIVELNAPCGASGLFSYDLADAVVAAETVVPGGAARSGPVAVSACGRQAKQVRRVYDGKGEIVI